MTHFDAGGDQAGNPEMMAETFFEVPMDVMPSLWATERKERRAVYDTVRDRLQDLENQFAYGSLLQSYFCIHTASGRRQILLSRADHSDEGIDQAFHVLINEEERYADGSLVLHYAEWALDYDRRSAVYKKGLMHRTRLANAWLPSDLRYGVYVDNTTSGVHVFRGTESELLIPPLGWRPKGTEALDTRLELEALAELLDAYHLPASCNEPLERTIPI
jgi:hypothetical protein